ncbi:Golgi transport complex subunit 3 [Coemansia biformis]|uniref:Conserved oligomeric Golgi complex subunit 3 n=1 Tax=Coemansia biformis TaxID=1286918 RepID=A0A9W8CVL5_9FUNG|nr:Golgi transport complex subunit 3 [Coemansia biformis]
MPAGASPSLASDDWEQSYAVSESCRAGIAQLQEACALYPMQLLVQCTASSERAGPHPGSAGSGAVADRCATPKLNPQLHHLRGSPLLSARRNASLRNLAALTHALGSRPRADSLDSGAAHTASGLGITVGAEDEPAGDDAESTAGEHAAVPVETTAQFLEWYGKVESQLMAGQDQEAHTFAESLRERVDRCSDMLQCIDGIEGLLADMEADYGRVRELTGGVKAACAEFQSKRDRLVDMSAGLSELLEVYNALGPITQLLNSPGDRVCLDRDFLPSLERAESAMAAIERHPEGRDSELYLMRFSQCRMRALSLIKLHALRVFKSLSTAVASGTPQSPLLSRSTALYVRFRAAAVQLSPLLRALQQRATAAGSTERQVLADVQNAYFQLRRAWLRPYVQDSLKSVSKEYEAAAALAAATTDGDAADARETAATHVGALRDWCAFMMNVCADEYRLYYDLFDPRQDVSGAGGSGGGVAMSAELRTYLDTVMTVFHERVRPLVIHEHSVSALAGISMILLTYHRSAAAATGDETGYGAGASGAAGAARDSADFVAEEDGLDAFYDVVDQILQDAQQRLAYRAQAFIRSHIAGYKVTKADAESLAQWARLCAQLATTGPAELSALVAEAAKSTDLQGSGPASADTTQPASRSSSSFVYLATAAVPATAAGSPAQSTAGGIPGAGPSGVAQHGVVMARFVEKMPGGRLSAADAESLQWVYPPVQSCRWLVAQIDGCLAPSVQAGIAEEAQMACKQNLLSQGARHVREKGAAVAGADAEQLAHLLVTVSLDLLAHAPPDRPISP